MYIVLSGSVKIKDPDSKTNFASLTKNNFGEMALLDKEPRLLKQRQIANKFNRIFRTDLMSLISFPKWVIKSF